MRDDISGTSAATYKLLEPHRALLGDTECSKSVPKLRHCSRSVAPNVCRQILNLVLENRYWIAGTKNKSMTMTTTATAIKTTAKQKRPITLTTTETVTNNEVTNYKYSGNNITDNIFFCHNDCDRNTVATTATATTTTTAATTTAATTTAATTTTATTTAATTTTATATTATTTAATTTRKIWHFFVTMTSFQNSPSARVFYASFKNRIRSKFKNTSFLFFPQNIFKRIKVDSLATCLTCAPQFIGDFCGSTEQKFDHGHTLRKVPNIKFDFNVMFSTLMQNLTAKMDKLGIRRRPTLS